MTTGAPIYLVTACASGEEFVAAFRRYADRNGLFVPIAEPLPSGRRGRFAVALKDGGVMIEGEAEIVSAAHTPSVLHGRVGMTLRFIDPGEPSKTVLVELELARLAMKPPPPSVPPRPASIPAEPRPVPPPPGGKIDAANALAECVAIGNVDALGTAPPRTTTGSKFVVPTIPPVAGARPKSLSTPPIGFPVRDRPITRQHTAIGVAPEKPRPSVVAPTPSGPVVEISNEATDLVTIPPTLDDLAVGRVDTHPDPPRPGDPRTREPSAPPSAIELLRTRDPSNPMPIAVSRTATLREPVPLSQTVRGKPPGEDLLSTQRETSAEQTRRELELASQELRASQRSDRRTAMGIAVAPDGVTVLPAAPPAVASDDDLDTAMMAAQPSVSEPNASSQPGRPLPPVTPAARALESLGKKRDALPSPNVEESTPSGDWTMAPGAAGPTIVPRQPDSKPAVKPTSEPTARLPTGDWMIARVEDSPSGWSEPSQVERPAFVDKPEPPDPAIVASSVPLESTPKKPEPEPASAEPKVQIDPSLVEPLAQSAVPTPNAAMPVMPPAIPGVPPSGMPPYPMPYPGLPASTVAPHAYASDPNQIMYPPLNAGPHLFPPPYPNPRSMALGVDGNRRRMIIIGSAVGAAFVGVVLLVVMTSARPQPSTAERASSQTEPDATPDAATIVEPVGVATAIDAARAAPGCAIEITSVPSGAEVLTEDATTALGTTPASLTVPCGVEARFVLKKPRYLDTKRAVTPTADKLTKVRVPLAKPIVSVKVSSTPPGATITVGGRVLGVTPTTIKLPSSEASTVTITKDGFATETQRVTPRQNNATIHTTLKRRARRPIPL